MKKSTDQLNELIEIARDGRSFYMEAAAKVRDTELHQILSTQAAAKELLINDLSQHVVSLGDIASKDETIVGRTRKMYAEILATLSTDRDRVYITQIEEVEGRLLEHFRMALQETESGDVQRVLASHITTVQSAYDRMKELKKKKAA